MSLHSLLTRQIRENSGAPTCLRAKYDPRNLPQSHSLATQGQSCALGGGIRRNKARQTIAVFLLLLVSNLAPLGSAEDVVPTQHVVGKPALDLPGRAFSLPNNVDELPKPARIAPKTAIPRANARTDAARLPSMDRPGTPATPPNPMRTVVDPSQGKLDIFDPNVRTVSGDSNPSTLVPVTGVHVPSPRASASMQPSLDLTQTVAADIAAGEPCVIEIVVANRGTVPAEKVIVTDQITGGLEVVSGNPRPELSGNTAVWSLGRLEPGENKRIELTVLAKAVSSENDTLARATLSYSTSVESPIRLLSPCLDVKLEGPDRVIVGQPVEIQITVSNTGTSTASNVELRDTLPPGLSHSEGSEIEYSVGTLAPGESKKIPLVLNAESVGDLVNRVVVTADRLLPVDAERKILVEDLHLTVKGEGPSVRYLNQACTYRFVVVNAGQVDSPASQLVVTMPESMSFAHASEQGLHLAASRSVEWAVEPMKPGQTRELTLTGVAENVGRIDCMAQVKVGERTIDANTVTTSVKGIAAINVEVVDLADPVEVGGETIYQIKVKNHGTLPQTGVVVTCEIPPEAEAVAADGPVGQKILDNVLSFEPLAQIAPKAEVLYRIKCRGKTDGQVRFKAMVKSNEIATPITKEENTTYFGG